MSTRERMFEYSQRRKSPSFSSSLLDSIYRSIDEKEEDKNMKMQQEVVDYEDEVPSLRRAIMIEKWMEDRKSNDKITTKHTFKNSNGSNSSDSSCCGTIFSSSDNESATRSRQVSSSFQTMQTPKREKKFITTTKSRALQIYSELKKVKQPISPGGRIASLLNSIFSSKNIKKSKLNEGLSAVTKSRSLREHTTTSSAPSISRTCLSNGMKRAVRFGPVGVNFVDGSSCGRKNIHKDDSSTIVSFPIMKNAEKIKYNAVSENVIRGIYNDHKDYEEDDTESCSSSDLFELDNIKTLGVEVYAEELPVYGTTNLKTNKVIANGYVF